MFQRPLKTLFLTVYNCGWTSPLHEKLPEYPIFHNFWEFKCTPTTVCTVPGVVPHPSSKLELERLGRRLYKPDTWCSLKRASTSFVHHSAKFPAQRAVLSNMAWIKMGGGTTSITRGKAPLTRLRCIHMNNLRSPSFTPSTTWTWTGEQKFFLYQQDNNFILLAEKA